MLDFRDPAAFRDFIAQHQDKVFNLALKLVQHVQDAEEITQDVFIDVYRKPEAFRGEAAVTTWLYRIAANKCIDHRRKQLRRQRRFLLFGPARVTEPVHFIHPGALAESKEKTVLLFRALRALPPNQEMSWVLSEMEGMSYKEISEVMNTSVPAVESLLVRAKKNLTKKLSAIYDRQATMD